VEGPLHMGYLIEDPEELTLSVSDAGRALPEREQGNRRACRGDRGRAAVHGTGDTQDPRPPALEEHRPPLTTSTRQRSSSVTFRTIVWAC
jgi:hypothetical protein